MKINLSAVIITFNEEKNIKRCVESLEDLADEILVLDSFSTDATKSICSRLGVRFVEHPFSGHKEQKNHATSLAKYNYILSLDADEALSGPLRKEIRGVKQNWQADAYRFNRLTRYGKKWIYHSNWYPDAKIRLFDRQKARWGCRHEKASLHEFIQTDKGAHIKHIPGDLLHYSFSSISEHVQKIDHYTTLAAQEDFDCGKKIYIIHHLFFRPFRYFVKAYLRKRGFLDGMEGFIICVISSFDIFLRYAKLKELRKSSSFQNHSS
ncbi:MAG: glycosyltransferase family 2 protein [Bacteriovoracales bacterium]|nr:glycosyltransferase family 2 protein [Bacteriovoracales bacterium]